GRAHGGNESHHGGPPRRLAGGILRRRPSRRGRAAGQGPGGAARSRGPDLAGAGAAVLPLFTDGFDRHPGDAPAGPRAAERRGVGKGAVVQADARKPRGTCVGEELVSGLGPALGLLLSLAPAVLVGQTPPPTATAHAVATPPVVDGRLPEPAWLEATPVPGFVQRELPEGAPVTARP